MMTNLFSIFDPSSSLNLLWMNLIMVLLLSSKPVWNSPSTTKMLMLKLSNYLKTEFQMSFQPNSTFNLIMFISIFILISTTNLLGLLPYVFTSTTHMLTALTLALLMWLSFYLYTWTKSPNNMLSHLLPLGTPSPLMMFMIMIETISSIIRPLTLAIRLMANMTAGHLIMCLISSQIPTLKMSLIFMFPLLTLMILELAVAFIQSYVFSTLLTLYLTETK